MSRKFRTRPVGKCAVSILLTLGSWLVLAVASGNGQAIPEPIKAQHKTLYPDYHSGVNIARQTQAGKDVDAGGGSFSPLYADESSPEKAPAYPDYRLRGIACDADAIVIASPKSAETDLTETGDFLYTDTVFYSEAVLKNPAASNLSATSEIIVTRPGGETRIDRRSVRTEAFSFPQFQLNRRYLLFLRYLPESKTYEAFRNGIFILPKSGAPTPINSTQELNMKSARREDTFLTEVRAAATAPCSPDLTPRLY